MQLTRRASILFPLALVLVATAIPSTADAARWRRARPAAAPTPDGPGDVAPVGPAANGFARRAPRRGRVRRAAPLAVIMVAALPFVSGCFNGDITLGGDAGVASESSPARIDVRNGLKWNPHTGEFEGNVTVGGATEGGTEGGVSFTLEHDRTSGWGFRID